MKVLPFEIPKASNAAVLFQVDQGSAFYGRLHRHEEIQVSLIISGRGDLLVAESIHAFQPGDLFIIGSNTPHLFRSVEEESPVHMITVFFTEDSFGAGFFAKDELRKVKLLLEQASTALRFSKLPEFITAKMQSLETHLDVLRITRFLEILDALSLMEPEQLSSFKAGKFSAEEGERIGKVINYAMEHYQEKVKLTDVASVAHMTPNAFCRYFKLRTNKSFFQFLTEIRMSHAQRYLLHTDKTVLEIAYATGYKNISHFNRQFLQHFGVSPTKFRKEKGI